MKFKLTKNGIKIPNGALDGRAMTKLRNATTITTKGFGDRLQTHACCRKHGDVWYAPRVRGVEILDSMGHTVDCRIAPGDEVAFPQNVALKDYQQPIFEFLTGVVFSAQSVEVGLSSCILDLQAGLGKSFLAMRIMEHVGKRTLYVVPGCDLVTQTVKLLRETYPDLTVGEYSGTAKTDGDIVVATIDSVANTETFTFKRVNANAKAKSEKITMAASDYFARFGFTVFDECHKYCTKERSKALSRASSLITLGMSASCNHRIDKMDKIAHYHLGAPVSGAQLIQKWRDAQPETKSGVAEAAEAKWKFAPVCYKYNGPREYTESLLSTNGTVSCPRMITRFTMDPYRAQMGIDIIHDLYDKKHHIFVLADRTELCELVRDYIETAFPASVDGVRTVSIVTGKTPAEERKRAREARIIVGTISCLGTGISFDEFSAIVFWHPRRNGFEQFINRIFRANGDREIERVAAFICDNATSLKSQYYGFRKVCISERDKTPEIVQVDYQDVDVSDRVRKIARDFEEWHAKREEEKEKEI